MANSRSVNSGPQSAALTARERRRAALYRNSPRWLRGLATTAGVIAVLVIVAAFLANSELNTGGKGTVAFVVWAVLVAPQCLMAGVIFLANAADRTPWGLAIALTVMTAIGGTAGLVAFVIAAVQAELPEWLAALGVVIHTLVLLVFGLGVLWPAVVRLVRSLSTEADSRDPD